MMNKLLAILLLAFVASVLAAPIEEEKAVAGPVKPEIHEQLEQHEHHKHPEHHHHEHSEHHDEHEQHEENEHLPVPEGGIRADGGRDKRALYVRYGMSPLSLPLSPFRYMSLLDEEPIVYEPAAPSYVVNRYFMY